MAVVDTLTQYAVQYGMQTVVERFGRGTDLISPARVSFAVSVSLGSLGRTCSAVR